jgi:hypothetical protein
MEKNVATKSLVLLKLLSKYKQMLEITGKNKIIEIK